MQWQSNGVCRIAPPPQIPQEEAKVLPLHDRKI